MKKALIALSLLALILASNAAWPQNNQPGTPQLALPPPTNNSFQPSSIDPKIPLLTITKVVPVNESRVVGFAVFLNPDCSPIDPTTVKTTENPKHGKITMEKGEEFTHYAPSSPLSPCNSKRVSGIKIRYEPNEKFVGTDFFRAMTISGEGGAVEYAIKIIIIQ